MTAHLPGGDRRWMARALHLARRSLGSSWPNPPVACVLTRDNRLVASGRTAPGGRPHAEAEALAAAGAAARGATAYVTLEPCAHHGRTPPCADALVAAGIGRCLAAIPDPDPRVSGRGLARLRAAGIPVETGLLAGAAAELLAGHARRLADDRPWLTLKVAATLDGVVGGPGPSRLAITGERARAFVETLRREHDAVLVGIGTVLADNPLLLPQNPGLAAAPRHRIILDARLDLPPDSRLAASAGGAPLLLVHGPVAAPERRARLVGCGIRLLESPLDGRGRLRLRPALARLAAAGYTRILVEAGPRLATTLLAALAVDELVWLTAGRLPGREEPTVPVAPAAPGAGLELSRCFRLGADTATVWRPRAPTGSPPSGSTGSPPDTPPAGSAGTDPGSLPGAMPV